MRAVLPYQFMLTFRGLMSAPASLASGGTDVSRSMSSSTLVGGHLDRSTFVADIGNVSRRDVVDL